MSLLSEDWIRRRPFPAGLVLLAFLAVHPAAADTATGDRGAVATMDEYLYRFLKDKVTVLEQESSGRTG